MNKEKMKANIYVLENVQLCRDCKFLGQRKMDYPEQMDYPEKMVILNQATIY